MACLIVKLGFFKLIIKANSVLCVQCVKWICRCVGVKWVTPNFSRYIACRKCDRNTGEPVEQQKRLCNEVKTIRVYISR